MYCRKCGTKLSEDMEFCKKCGTKVKKDEDDEQIPSKKEIKYSASDVVNSESVLNSTNRVAYIANGWALKIRDRGITFAVIVAVITFFAGIANETSTSSTGTFLEIFIPGLIGAFLIFLSFNTTAFIIRMGAEVIQLLDDIKNKR